MTTLSKTRSQTYRAARDMGNLQALMKGPIPYSKRVVRRKVYRGVNRNLAKFLKGAGL